MESHSPLSPLLLDDLIIEILSWLPVNILLRFRCVSKSWKSLISNNPNFIRLHMRRSPSNSNLILILQSYPLHDNDTDAIVISCSKNSLFHNPLPLIFIPEDGRYRLKDHWTIGSCNGLVCFKTSHFVGDTMTLWFRFWNPALRLRSKKSPPLIFNRSKYSWVGTGFGYDNLTDMFKVVVVISFLEKITIQVHNMGDNCWREIFSSPAFPLLDERSGQFVSDTLNWLALRKSGSAYEWGNVIVNQIVIFSLHLGKETYKHLLLPAGFRELPSHEPTLGVLKDCLCLYHSHRGTHLVVWQMKEFGVETSWTQLINVSYQHLQFKNDPHPWKPLPLCTSENGDVIMLENNKDYKAILYNWKDNRVQHIEIPNDRVWMDAKDHVQSLVLPC